MTTKQVRLKDGGPAFPSGIIRNDDGDFAYGTALGMSLRDWFAGQFAMVATCEGLKGYDHICPTTVQRTAQHAYALADAMLAERAKK